MQASASAIDPLTNADTLSDATGTRSLALHLFLTRWIVYALHFATDIVREIYPALSLGENFSFRLDDCVGNHPHIPDEVAYLLHARIFAEGHLSGPPLPVPEAFEVYLRRAEEGRTFVVTPPAFPALLALG